MPVDPNDWQAQQVQLQKQQQLAQLLRGQATADVGQTVGGRVVAATPFQVLAKLGAGYFANDAEAKANTTQQKIAKGRQAAVAEALRKYGESQDPSVLAGSNIPELQAAGIKQLTTPKKYGEKPNFDRDGRAYVLGSDGSIKFLDGVTRQSEVSVAPNGVPYDKYSPLPAGTEFADKSKPFNSATGEAIKPVQDFQKAKAALGATKVSNNITNSTEKSYAGQVAEGLAKNDVAAVDAGKTGIATVQSAQNIKRALDSGKTITGPGANVRLKGKQVAVALGLSSDEEGLAQTRGMLREMSQLVLGARKQMQGQGQITDKESALAERVAGGDIDMTPAEIRVMADLAERAGRLQIKAANKVAGRLKNDKNFGSVGQDISIDEPAEYVPKTNKPTVSGW